MTKFLSKIIVSGITIALVAAVLIPTHVAMARFGINIGVNIGIGSGSVAPTNVFGLKNLIIGLINNVFVPVIFALAFIVFIWGIFSYFIAGAEDPAKQEKGKQLIIYGIIGFVVMVSVWGLVNVLANTFGLNSSYVPQYPTLPLR